MLMMCGLDEQPHRPDRREPRAIKRPLQPCQVCHRSAGTLQGFPVAKEQKPYHQNSRPYRRSTVRLHDRHWARSPNLTL
jgi:hypothetical protein